MPDNPYRNLPSVNEVLQTELAQRLERHYAHEQVVEAVRAELQVVRRQLAEGKSLENGHDKASIAVRLEKRLASDLRPKLRRVINATGIVLHTNLGRAPVAEAAARAAYEAAAGYLNLELDLETGQRSSRQDALRDWLCRLTGAESATAVNNNAAATVIALRALCMGKEVILSRGQLIEIGGSFRIPEIMSVSGATLREVGTTNITRLADFEKAIGPNTAALMQIHTSNYCVRGFTQAVPLADLVTLGKKHGLKVIDDIGSGAMIDFARFGFEAEPIARDSIAAGADLVLFSGDKLLGGPQAGILAGKREWIQKVEKDPLMRAFRLDKMTLASLEATLRLYLNEERALRDIPTLRMLDAPLADLQRRAQELAEKLAAVSGVRSAVVEADVAYVGGGSLPDQKMDTWVVKVKPQDLSEDDMAQRLRVGTPALLGRVQGGQLVLDVRTIFPEQLDETVAAVRQALVYSSEPEA